VILPEQLIAIPCRVC